jgi:hypothetical protein
MAETSGLILKARAGQPGNAGTGVFRLVGCRCRRGAGGTATGDARHPLEDQEAAVRRISAASCYQHAGALAKAINLYRAALAGPLPEHTRLETEQLLAASLAQFALSANGHGTARRP